MDGLTVLQGGDSSDLPLYLTSSSLLPPGGDGLTTISGSLDPYYGAQTQLSTSGGSTLGLTTEQLYAQQQAAEQDALRDSVFRSKDNAINTANTSGTNFYNNYNAGILDYLDSYRQADSALDERSITNELAKRRGLAGITDMIGQGLQSGGVLLASKNASDSSAAEGLARAYSRLGQRAGANVGNQYELENRGITQARDSLATGLQSQTRRNQLSKDSFLSSLATEVQNTLAALNEQLIGAGIEDRIAIESEKQAVKDRALQQLARADSMFSQETAKVRPIDQTSAIAQAQGLDTAGQQTGAMYNFEFNPNMGFSGGQAPISPLPIYTAPRRRV